MAGKHLATACIIAAVIFCTIQARADFVDTTLSTGLYPHGIAVDTITNKIYVANFGGHSVSVINGENSSTATIAAGTNPYNIAVNPVTNKIYVADANNDSVTIIDGATNTTFSIATKGASAIVLNPATNKIYTIPVGGSSGTVTVIDGATNLTTTVSAGTYAAAIAINPVTNKIYVANKGTSVYSNGTVTVIDGATNAITTVSTAAYPTALAVNPVTNMIYVANDSANHLTGAGNITIINGATNSTSIVPAGTEPVAIAINSVTNKIYVMNDGRSAYHKGTVTVIDGVTDTTITVAIGSYPDAIAVNCETNKIYVANGGDNTVTVIDGVTNSTSTVTVGTEPVVLSVNQVKNRVYVANFESSNVTVIDGALFIKLISPPNNATNEPLNPALIWSTTANATGYNVQVSTNATFSTAIINSNISSNTLSTALNAATKYYWRVAGTHGGNIGQWAMDSFTTAQSPPAATILATPSNGAVNVPLSLTLNWNPSAGTNTYRVQLSNSTSFSFSTDTTIQGTSRTLNSLLTYSTYFWRVNASNAYGTSPWSTIFSFTTTPPAPTAPVLFYPSNGSTTVPMNPVLRWDSCSYASTYDVQVSNSSSFQIIIDTVVSGTVRSLSPLSAYSTYFWRVNSSNADGTSAWSTVWNFTTTNIGVLNGEPHYTRVRIGYSGFLAVYSLNGRQVLKIPFAASATKEAVLRSTDKMPVKGIYIYQFLEDRKVMDEGNFIVK